MLVGATLASAAEPAFETFQGNIQPILDEFCYDCHGYGSEKGGVKLDGFESAAALHDHKLWLRALKNVRAGIMPPAGKPKPSAEQAEALMTWIKRGAFGLDPAHPDPGKMTVRRLNRVEYRNTIRDLLGVDFDTEKEFPADDTGQGFDNIADVLTISPMLLEKYLDAAQTIIAKAVPTQSRVVAEIPVLGRQFMAVATKSDAEAPVETVAGLAEAGPGSATPAAGRPGDGAAAKPVAFKRPPPAIEGDALDLSYYTPVSVTATHHVKHAGKYQLVVNLRSIERYVDDQFDYNRCRVVFKADGQTLLDREFVREGDKAFDFTFDREWRAGAHELALEIHPVAPGKPQPRLLRIRLRDVTVRGPLSEKYWVQPADYAKFFPRKIPASASARKRYAHDILEKFATRAFRRPADPTTVDRLVALAESIYAHPENTFESGIAQAMTAVLASPRFLFREEGAEPLQPGQIYPNVDEYALASRLSYFLWSTMPDDELFRLATEHRLRAELPAQVDRMLKDNRSNEFVRNFTGQWLQARDVPNVQINNFDIFLREHPNPDLDTARATFRRVARIPEAQRTPEDKEAFAVARKAFIGFIRQTKPQLTDSLRRAMRRETEMYFDYILHEDRSVVELIESNYTFLNEELAKHYGVEGVTGSEMRKVELPPDSPRGGVLTQGTVLTVTSNPTRTSPVKRGVFILDAILGTPPAPPPPNIPALEDAASPDKLKQMSLRENLSLHASNKMCASCHARMDPLGLAMENFNAMGQWRAAELNQPIDPAGKLITGEKFADMRELKHVLATSHRRDFFYCLVEKFLTYALGRAVDYYDTDTVDQLVAQLEAADGRPSALVRGIIASAPFQQRRPTPELHASNLTVKPGPN
jgi:hypothetical protein